MLGDSIGNPKRVEKETEKEECGFEYSFMIRAKIEKLDFWGEGGGGGYR